jgi:RNA-directed DNA polymerase
MGQFAQSVPAVEDKLLQRAVARILEAIDEQDFRRCSDGDRPNVGALDAVDKLTIKRQFGRYHFVVEAAIKGFFDNIQHDWLIRMLEERLEDGALLRLIRKWLKAGALDSGGHGGGRTGGGRGEPRHQVFHLACGPSLGDADGGIA